MMKSAKHLMIASVAAIGIAHCQSALAQTATKAEPATPATVGVQDIVVTAQRRSENLQKSSLVIQVLSGESLSRAAPAQASDLNTLVPGIQIAAIGSTTQISIRGISDNSSNALGNPSVAVNVDGVYVGQPAGIGNNFFDLDRIEVLKGPQGTLYGRNASGGAVNLITKAPVLGATDGYFEFEGGNYSDKRVTGAFNLGISDTFAVRAAFQDVDRDGFLSDGSSDLKYTAGRMRALWQPSTTVKLLLNFDIAHDGGQGAGTVLRPLADGQNPWQSINDAQSATRLYNGSPSLPVGPGVVFNTQNGLVNQGVPSQDNDFYNASVQLDWDFGPATLTILPSYRRADTNFHAWNGFSFQQRDSDTQKSLELRIAHNSGSLKWVFGGYLFDDDQNVHARVITNLVIQNLQNNYLSTTKSYAGFGEANYSISSNLRIIAGIRYTDEPKSVNGATINDSLSLGAQIGSVSELITGSKTFKATTWKAGAEYDVTPTSMLFFTASTGFKSGGFSTVQSTAAIPNFYLPEKLTAYVLGMRNRFFGNRLQVNLEAFYYDYTDKQESAIGFTPFNNLAFLTTNAGKARIKGASIDVIARVTSLDTIRLYAEYNDNHYISFSYEVPTGVFNPTSSTCGQNAGPVTTTVDCSGRPLVKAPEWVGSFGYDHRFELAGGATITTAIDGQFSSKEWVGTDYLPGELAKGYVIGNATLTYAAPSKAWSVTAFVRNVTNQATYQNGNAEPLQAPLVTASIGAPRTYGARVRFNF